MSYVSRLPYTSERIGAAAIYCSDGRVGEHFDDFLHHGLNLPRYDRVALPGGPACLAGHTEAHVTAQGIVEELKFLVEAHGLERIVLIAHQGCAFYTSRLHLPEHYLAYRQSTDLARAATFIRRHIGIDRVEAYYARREQGEMVFDPVEVS